MQEFNYNHLDYLKIYNTSRLPSYIRNLAKDLIQYQYVVTGDFFESMDDVEIAELVNTVETVHAKNTDQMHQFIVESEQAETDLQNLILFAMLLAAGEGESEIISENISDYVTGATVLIAVESLHRKGLAIAHRKNYSVLDGSKPIAERISK